MRLNNNKNAKEMEIKYIDKVCNITAVGSNCGSEKEAQIKLEIILNEIKIKKADNN